MASIIEKETDARFWAQTGYKPGVRLSRSDPQDVKMMPVWRRIRDQVQREFEAHTLVTTFDHPVTSTALSEAAAAHQAATAYLEAAATTSDPAAAAAHAEAAAAHAEAAAHSTQEAATVQPPSTSPRLVEEAAARAASAPPPPGAQAGEQIAHAQILAAHRPPPLSIVDRETAARFWAQTGYRPGQYLDPTDGADQRMHRLWRAIRQAVQREQEQGRLVLTYNDPVVVRRIAEARSADRAAVASLEAAATDPRRVVDVATAASAAQAAADRTREAAARQPPTVPPDLAREVAREFTRAPSRADGARGHMAREQARRAGNHAAEVHRHHARRRHPVRSAVSPDSLRAYRDAAGRLAREGGGSPALVTVRPDGSLERQALGSRADLDAAFARASDDHEHYRYVAAFDPASGSAPLHESVGVPAAETPGPDPTPVEQQAPPGDERAGSPDRRGDGDGAGSPTGAPAGEGWSVGKIALVVGGAAALVVGGLLVVRRSRGRDVSRLVDRHEQSRSRLLADVEPRLKKQARGRLLAVAPALQGSR